MKVTKFEHACFTVEHNNKVIVVDPGNFSSSFVAPENVEAVVITHNHQDHLDHDHLSAIMDKNPSAIIIGPQQVVDEIDVFETRVVSGGDSVSFDEFDLKFFGDDHAAIHSSMPHVDNTGVLINDLLFFPGDALTVPEGVAIDTLALPVSAPWMKLGEAVDYLEAVHPNRAFPVHEALYTEAAQAMVNRMLSARAESLGIEYTVVGVGESIDV